MKGVSALSERLTYKTELGISLDANEDCPTMSICWNCDIPPRKCKYFDEAIKKLAEYEDLDEQGLLLRLPCKVGDTVWEIVDECEGDSAGCYGTCDACHNRRLGIEETKFAIDMTDEVGNWFFLTQSEAEEKLRELNKESEE